MLEPLAFVQTFDYVDKDIHTSSLLVYAYLLNMVGSAVFGSIVWF